MLRRFVAAACLLGGCNTVFDLDRVNLHPNGDSGVDDSADAPDAPRFCYGSYAGGFLRICLEPGVDDDWTPGGTIDTSANGDCEQIVMPSSGKPLCVIAAARITIDQQIDVKGPYPLVLVATDTLTIGTSGDLLANSKRDAVSPKKGPGANPAACSTALDGVESGGGSGGAAGGTNGSKGGNGGDGAAAAGTAAAPVASDSTTLRGGCPGGAGGGAVPSSSGDGGGALYLIAANQISVSGKIDASGAGGGGTNPTKGGSGGGSGGTIIFDSPVIDFTGARVIAHGGGGGGGGAGGTFAGVNGKEVDYGLANFPASGGAGGPDDGTNGAGGNGGRGTDRVTAAGVNGSSITSGSGGGGGGGGGHGLIRSLGATTKDVSTTISPALTP